MNRSAAILLVTATIVGHALPVQADPNPLMNPAVAGMAKEVAKEAATEMAERGIMGDSAKGVLAEGALGAGVALGAVALYKHHEAAGSVAAAAPAVLQEYGTPQEPEAMANLQAVLQEHPIFGPRQIIINFASIVNENPAWDQNAVAILESLSLSPSSYEQARSQLAAQRRPAVVASSMNVQ